MSIKIENYRGYDIMFDPNNEKFFVEISDTESKDKASYSAVKKWIDDYIKDNQEFVPFRAINRSCEIINVIGIRKDGGWVILNKRGEKEKLSNYYEKDYFIYEPSVHDAIVQEIRIVSESANTFRKKESELRDTITGTQINTLKKNYIQ